ncbi:MAG TPA: cysteine synthase family protein [Candidatus Acidoferrales bacterium]|nr:cysteine synthase family protein [Candidatus Acidoferrales bacterium]
MASRPIIEGYAHRADKPLGQNLPELVGHTPLLRLDSLTAEFPNAEFYAKAEWVNPGGSVKDRAALYMIREGERAGALHPGKTILDATSGNTGIALAMLGAALGYSVKLCIPASASHERLATLRALGANLILTPGEEGSDGAIRRACEIAGENPAKYFYIDQYTNPANPRAHYETTGPEIWTQTNRTLTHFVAGLGTSGTFMGVTRRLKELNPAICAISVQPDEAFHGLEGLKHMATAIVPAIYDASLADANLTVRTEDAFAMVRKLARETGLLVGVSSGAALCACRKVAEGLERGEQAVIVTIFPDSGERYLSERFWNEEREE